MTGARLAAVARGPVAAGAAAAAMAAAAASPARTIERLISEPPDDHLAVAGRTIVATEAHDVVTPAAADPVAAAADDVDVVVSAAALDQVGATGAADAVPAARADDVLAAHRRATTEEAVHADAHGRRRDVRAVPSAQAQQAVVAPVDRC